MVQLGEQSSKTLNLNSWSSRFGRFINCDDRTNPNDRIAEGYWLAQMMRDIHST